MEVPGISDIVVICDRFSVFFFFFSLCFFLKFTLQKFHLALVVSFLGPEFSRLQHESSSHVRDHRHCCCLRNIIS